MSADNNFYTSEYPDDENNNDEGDNENNNDESDDENNNDEGDDNNDDENNDGNIDNTEQEQFKQQIKYIPKTDVHLSSLPDKWTKFQWVGAIVAVVNRINNTGESYAQMLDGSHNPYELAIAEIVHNVAPIAIARPDGTVWSTEDFKYYPPDYISTIENIKKRSRVK